MFCACIKSSSFSQSTIMNHLKGQHLVATSSIQQGKIKFQHLGLDSSLSFDSEQVLGVVLALLAAVLNIGALLILSH